MLDTFKFSGCDSLKEIKVHTENPSLYCVDGALFQQTGTEGKTLLRVPNAYAGVFTVPQDVDMVWKGAFVGCSNLTGISFLWEEDVGSIAIYTGSMANCPNLQWVRFKGMPASITYGPSDNNPSIFGDAAVTVYYPQEHSSWWERESAHYLTREGVRINFWGPNVTFVMVDANGNPVVSPAPAPDAGNEDNTDRDDDDDDPPAPTPAPTAPPAPTAAPARPAPTAVPAVQPTASPVPALPELEQQAEQLANQLLSGGAPSAETAAQLLDTIKASSKLFVSETISAAMQKAILDGDSTEQTILAEDGRSAVAASYPKQVSQNLKVLSLTVDPAQSVVSLEAEFEQKAQSPLGVWVVIRTSKALDPNQTYQWTNEDGQSGYAEAAVCGEDGFKTQFSFFAPHFSVYTIAPAGPRRSRSRPPRPSRPPCPSSRPSSRPTARRLPPPPVPAGCCRWFLWSSCCWLRPACCCLKSAAAQNKR